MVLINTHRGSVYTGFTFMSCRYRHRKVILKSRGLDVSVQGQIWRRVNAPMSRHCLVKSTGPNKAGFFPTSRHPPAQCWPANLVPPRWHSGGYVYNLPVRFSRSPARPKTPWCMSPQWALLSSLFAHLHSTSRFYGDAKAIALGADVFHSRCPDGGCRSDT